MTERSIPQKLALRMAQKSRIGMMKSLLYISFIFIFIILAEIESSDPATPKSLTFRESSRASSPQRGRKKSQEPAVDGDIADGTTWVGAMYGNRPYSSRKFSPSRSRSPSLRQSRKGKTPSLKDMYPTESRRAGELGTILGRLSV